MHAEIQVYAEHTIKKFTRFQENQHPNTKRSNHLPSTEGSVLRMAVQKKEVSSTSEVGSQDIEVAEGGITPKSKINLIYENKYPINLDDFRQQKIAIQEIRI